jgi:hypothetical protein
MKRDIRKAARLYEDFREESPRRARAVRVSLPKVAAVMGHVRAIEYDTTHGGKTHLYKHTFAPGSRPLLVAGTRNGQLYLIGGRYHVTGRGIVDKDARGREIEDGGRRKKLAR